MFQENSFSPDLADIIENMEQYTSPQELIVYLLEIQWNDVFKLYLPFELSDRDTVGVTSSNKLIESIKNEEKIYNGQIQGKRAASLASYNNIFTTNLRYSVIEFLKQRGITYSVAKVERDKTIDTLKAQLRTYVQQGAVEPSLYKMEVNETEALVTIRLQYTELGALIMWGTEIPHDLSSLDANTLSLINQKITQYTPKLRNMSYVNGKPVNYTENVASELCLDMLNLAIVPRCVQRHGKTELQIGHREVGHGIFPSIYNNTKVLLTSDANNTGNVEFSQVLQDSLYNINGKVAPFLNMDAGSAPSQIAFQESTEERYQLNNDTSNKLQSNELQKPVEITVYSPTGITMLHIQSNNNLTQYNVTIFSEDGSAQYKLVEPIDNLTITNVVNIVNSVSQPFKFNASLLKSLGDLIPYQTVCLQTALIDDDTNTTNVMGSIDYSMIFQLLGNVKYVKNNQDMTSDLNQRTILTGVNMENTNTYFPWSAHEKRIYRILLYMYSELGSDVENIIDQFKTVKQQIYTVIDNYTTTYSMTENVSEYLTHICIDDLIRCKDEISKVKTAYPESDKLLENLNTILQTLPKLNVDDITIFSPDDDEESQTSVKIDNLDYILAKFISRQPTIQISPTFMLPIISVKKVKPPSKNTAVKTTKPPIKSKYGKTYTKKNKQKNYLGGKCRKTIRKR